jgi:hypothetical protein
VVHFGSRTDSSTDSNKTESMQRRLCCKDTNVRLNINGSNEPLQCLSATWQHPDHPNKHPDVRNKSMVVILQDCQQVVPH